MTLVGSAETISAALDGLTFLPPPHYSGDVHIGFEIGYAPQSRDAASPSADSVEVPGNGDASGPRAWLTMPITIVPADDSASPSRLPDQAARHVEARPADQ